MNSNKISFRPVIKTIDKDKNKSDSERFQNATLRPIIKLQHQLLIAIFKNYVIAKKTSFQEISKEQFLKFVNSSVRKDTTFKNQLIGIIIGMFTTDELENYTQMSSEINKRIIQIIENRFVDSFEELKEK